MKNNPAINERELLELIGRFYKERNIELIRPYLHSNFIYSSAWVDEVLYGTKKFLNYIRAKFTAQQNFNWNMDYVILPLRFRKTHFILLKQNNERDKTTVVSVEFKGNRIYYIRLSPTKPVGFAFIEPSHNFVKAKEIYLSQKMHKFARQLDIKNVLRCLSKGAKLNARDDRGETSLTILSKATKLDSVRFVMSQWHFPRYAKSAEQLQKINAMKEKLTADGYFKELEWGENWRESSAHHELSTKLLDSYARRILKLPVADRIAMMKKLLERGAYVDDLNLSEIKQARNSLFYAVQQRETEMVELLLQHGADANFKYPGIKESLIELTKRDLKAEEEAGEDFILRDGKDIEMQRQEIENLKEVISLLENKTSTDTELSER